MILSLYTNRLTGFEPINVNIHKITMTDYEQHHYDKELLKQSAMHLGSIEVNPIADLEQIRHVITKHCEDAPEFPTLSPEWCFVDCKFNLYILSG